MANLSKLQSDALNHAAKYLVNAPVFTGDPGVSSAVPNAYGTAFGYQSGSVGSPLGVLNTIQKYTFPADNNSTDVADLLAAGYGQAGSNSSTHGYAAGGRTPSYSNVIQKFPFSVEDNATDVGDLNANRAYAAGISSPDHGYAAGGLQPPYTSTNYKYAFASDGNSTSVGPIGTNRAFPVGNCTDTTGYILGGRSPSYLSSTVKFPFASDTPYSPSGTLIIGTGYVSDHGQNSATDSYLSGGRSPSYFRNIQKMPFASEGSYSTVGNLLAALAFQNGNSSDANGYINAGNASGPSAPLVGGAGYKDIIQKFPFASDGDASDVGDLLNVSGYMSGNDT